VVGLGVGLWGWGGAVVPNAPNSLHPQRAPNAQVAQDAINDARAICQREYGTAPDVTIYGDPNFLFPYVPSHLHHMVFELVGGWMGGWVDGWMDELRRQGEGRGREVAGRWWLGG